MKHKQTPEFVRFVLAPRGELAYYTPAAGGPDVRVVDGQIVKASEIADLDAWFASGLIVSVTDAGSPAGKE